MQSIVKITAAEDVALVTLRGCPATLPFAAHIFQEIAAQNINVDMISQSAPAGGAADLSFTVAGGDIGAVLRLCARLRTETPRLKTDISGGNCKFSFSGEAMRIRPGVAGQVFAAAAAAQVDVRMITTSEVDISLLVPGEQTPAAREAFASAFALPVEEN